MKIFGPVLAAILAAAAIIAIVGSVRNQIVETERAEKALDERIRNTSAYLHAPAARVATSQRAEPTTRLPSAPATPVNANVVTITQRVSIALQYGSVSLSAGAKLPFVSRAGDTVRVRYHNGADYDIPVSATDLKSQP